MKVLGSQNFFEKENVMKVTNVRRLVVKQFMIKESQYTLTLTPNDVEPREFSIATYKYNAIDEIPA